MKETARIRTPAKLNLGLRIGRRLASGYHGLNTVFQAITLADELVISSLESPVNQVELTVTGPVSVPEGEANLLVKTYRFLRTRGVELPGLKIKLDKRIPTGAGLGGGSGNAAGLLLWVRDNFADFELSWRLRLQIARELGADIPFFLHGTTARGAGLGEQLLSLPPAAGWVVLAVPELEVSTESAYKALRENRDSSKKYSFNLPVLSGEESKYFWQDLKLTNDFWPLLAERHPQLRELRKELGGYSNYTGLTGSGSGLYALFKEREPAESAVQELREVFPGTDWYMEELGASVSTLDP